MSARRALTLLPQRFAVCRFDPGSPLPVWVLHSSASFWSITRTPSEMSVVCPEDDLPPSVDSDVERPWNAFALEGPIPFGETGVIVSLTAPLAAAGIPVFVLSTFETDLLLVKCEHAARAREILAVTHDVRGDGTPA